MNRLVIKQAASSPVWEGVYSNWQEACEGAQAYGGGKGLRGEIWFERITDQLLNYREELRAHGVAMPPRPCNLPLHCALTRPASIVDYGGSSGWCWDYLRESMANTVSSYTVIETVEVVDYMKRTGLQSDPVCYQTLEESLDSVDTLYCNSVLQYFASNDELLLLIRRSNPKFILLDDLVAGDYKDSFTIQLFRESAIPYRFLGLQPLLSDLAKLGYLLLMRFPYAAPINSVLAPLPMENFPALRQLRYSSSILLKRADSV